MKIIVYGRPDNGVSVVNLAPNFVAQFATEDEALVVVLAKDVPEDATDVEITDATLPDREFRDAWERDTSPTPSPIAINMTLAKGIHIGRIAQALESEIGRLKKEEARARLNSRPTDADKHVADRVVLENLDLGAEGVRLSNAQTPEALSAIWPTVLRRP